MLSPFSTLIFQEKRFAEFVSKKKQIVELFHEIDRNPQSDFECDVICEEDNTFLLSTENMKSLKVLLTEVWCQVRNLSREGVQMKTMYILIFFVLDTELFKYG